MAHPPSSRGSSSRRSYLARAEGILGSGLRFSSFFGSPLPSPVAAAALPTINNHILRKHLEAVNSLQQRMLEAELQCRPGGPAAASAGEEDDAPLPSTRYRHMSDLLPPDSNAVSLEEWKGAMQAEMLRRCTGMCAQQPQQSSADATEQLQQPQLSFAASQKGNCNWFFKPALRV